MNLEKLFEQINEQCIGCEDCDPITTAFKSVTIITDAYSRFY